MKENSPNLAKEIGFPRKPIGSPRSQRVPQKLDQRRNTPRHTIIKLPKIKDNERIFKKARGKETVTYKGVPTRLSPDFSKATLQARKD